MKNKDKVVGKVIYSSGKVEIIHDDLKGSKKPPAWMEEILFDTEKNLVSLKKEDTQIA